MLIQSVSNLSILEHARQVLFCCFNWSFLTRTVVHLARRCSLGALDTMTDIETIHTKKQWPDFVRRAQPPQPQSKMVKIRNIGGN